MALTMRLPSAETGPRVRSDPVTAIVRAEGTRTVIALRGEADISTRPSMSDVLCQVIALRAGDVIIDLAEATFVDTSIVRTLATAQQLLDRQGRTLTFRSPSRLAAHVLDLFGLTHLIETTEPVEP